MTESEGALRETSATVRYDDQMAREMNCSTTDFGGMSARLGTPFNDKPSKLVECGRQ
jgi:hypothetical protein